MRLHDPIVLIPFTIIFNVSSDRSSLRHDALISHIRRSPLTFWFWFSLKDNYHDHSSSSFLIIWKEIAPDMKLKTLRKRPTRAGPKDENQNQTLPVRHSLSMSGQGIGWIQFHIWESSCLTINSCKLRSMGPPHPPTDINTKSWQFQIILIFGLFRIYCLWSSNPWKLHMSVTFTRSKVVHRIKIHPPTRWVPPVLSWPCETFAGEMDTDPDQLHVVNTRVIQMEFELQVVLWLEVSADRIIFKMISLYIIPTPTVARVVHNSSWASLRGSRVVQLQDDTAVCTRLVDVGHFCFHVCHLRTTWSEEIFVKNIKLHCLQSLLCWKLLESLKQRITNAV